MNRSGFSRKTFPRDLRENNPFPFQDLIGRVDNALGHISQDLQFEYNCKFFLRGEVFSFFILYVFNILCSFVCCSYFSKQFNV